ncbi:SPOR domain-containing protein [Flavobacterium sp. AS60]|uniref:SPOR domain-containing protein n=1 Tax=Flavobacterium anseongense TaxID=2910677 RepID=UPI001F275C0E|nr:SPOR domain-containing protein [Flavobacterium sp. AS60]MCF6128446.1 SPOR domain-containing protein [Flavobacterium sp. AS60]
MSQKSFSQEAKVSVSQDPKFEQLLNEKRKINSSITINDRYKIQIFNGDTENSKKTLLDFKRENKNIDATIVFSTPLYKVWVGNYKTRIEAEKNLNDLKKKYPNAFLIKPNK